MFILAKFVIALTVKCVWHENMILSSHSISVGLQCFSPPQIFFSFMLTPLFKKPKFASTVGSMLTVVFGCLSLFTVLMKDFPQPVVWLLCLLSPSAFSIGIAQVTNTLNPTH